MPRLGPGCALRICKNRAKLWRRGPGSGIGPRPARGSHGAGGQRGKRRRDPELCRSRALGPWRTDLSAPSLNLLLTLPRGQISHPGLARTKRGNVAKGRFWRFRGVSPTHVASHASRHPLHVVSRLPGPCTRNSLRRAPAPVAGTGASPAETNRCASPRGAPRLTPGIDVGADVTDAAVKADGSSG